VHRQGIEPRNQPLQDADAVNRSGRPHVHGRQGEPGGSPARSETPRMHGHSMRENREILCSPAEGGRDASGRPRPYADDERAEEVGQVRSTDEATEQGQEYGCGGGGGKEPGQGEGGRAKHAPDTEPDKACPVRSPAYAKRQCALTSASEARAQCVSSARWDLCGGRSEPMRRRAVPTATKILGLSRTIVFR
jgi:hypothetical protein